MLLLLLSSVQRLRYADDRSISASSFQFSQGTVCTAAIQNANMSMQSADGEFSSYRQ